MNIQIIECPFQSLFDHSSDQNEAGTQNLIKVEYAELQF